MPSQYMHSSQEILGDALTSREINRAMKDIFKETFHNLGGAQWLQQFVQESPANARVFVQVLGKLIPPSPPEQKKPGAVIIDLPWVNQGRLSYRKNMENGEEELQED